MDRNSRCEICRFEEDGLLYRMYLFENGEVAFTVTGDTIRLGIVTQKDLAWDCRFELPVVAETSAVVNVQSHALRVLRTIALRLAQYLAKHKPRFFYYKVADDPRRHRVYKRLLQRHAEVAALFDVMVDDAGQYAMFTLKHVD